VAAELAGDAVDNRAATRTEESSIDTRPDPFGRGVAISGQVGWAEFGVQLGADGGTPPAPEAVEVSMSGTGILMPGIALGLT
jgi:hypothetical protein